MKFGVVGVLQVYVHTCCGYDIQHIARVPKNFLEQHAAAHQVHAQLHLRFRKHSFARQRLENRTQQSAVQSLQRVQFSLLFTEESRHHSADRRASQESATHAMTNVVDADLWSPEEGNTYVARWRVILYRACADIFFCIFEKVRCKTHLQNRNFFHRSNAKIVLEAFAMPVTTGTIEFVFVATRPFPTMNCFSAAAVSRKVNLYIR